MASRFRRAIVLALTVLLLLLYTGPSSALVTISPVRPTHEDQLTIKYSPSPGDNTTQVRLLLTINNTTTDDIDITGLKDNSTGNYTYDLGVLVPGTMISYSLIAWNFTVDDGNISVASVVTMRWHNDLDEAKATAARLHRPLFILFWSTDDRTNMEIMTRTFNDERVLNLSASFVCVKLRIDDDPHLADRWGISLEPAYIFLDNTSREVHRAHGNLTADIMLAHMNYALEKGPRPVDGPRALFANPVRNIIAVAFLLITVLGMLAIRARAWSRRP